MRRPVLILFFAAVLLSLLVTNVYDPADTSAVLRSEGEIVKLRGLVLSVCEKTFGFQAEMLCTSMDGMHMPPEKVLLRIDADDRDALYALCGRIAEAEGEISRPDGRRNPNCFDYSLYLKGRRIYSICSVNRYRINGYKVRLHLLNFLSVSKGRFYAYARQFLEEDEFSLIAGIMFGEKAFMSDELYGSFRENGIAHVLAVSGLHVGLMYGIAQKLNGGKKGKKSSIITLFLLFIYAALSDFSVSALRACFMISLNILAFHMRRRYDLICAAAACSTVFLLLNPFLLYNSGFQLSFCAAFSMGVCLPWLENKLLEKSDENKSAALLVIGKIFAPCLAVQLGMTPLCLYHFMMFSPLGFFVNPPAVFLAGLLLPAAFVLFLCFLISPGMLFGFALGPAKAFASMLISLSNFSSSLMHGIEIPAPPLGALILYYVCYFWFFSEGRYVIKRSGKNGFSLAFALLLCAALLFKPFDYRLPELVFLDVDQGDSVSINIGENHILIDGGGKYYSNIAEDVLKPYLLKNGIRSIDLAFVTHLDGDHYKGISELCSCFEVKTVALPACCKKELAGNEFPGAELLYLQPGDCIDAGGMTFTVLSPAADYSGGDNDGSLVLFAEGEDYSALFTGDLEFGGEGALLSAGAVPRADILKIAHHGSSGSTGEAFLRAADPAFAAISCGRGNSYGHPSPRVIDLLGNSDIIYARTDLYGAICLTKFNEKRLVFENAAKDVKWLISR